MKSLEECNYDLQKIVMKIEAKAENISPPEGNRPFRCENCGRQFSTSAYLSQHRRIHSGVKPYVCRFCDRKFTQLSHVQQHERIHTGEKPYSCATCMKSFTQMSNLHSHQRQHMKNKPCRCSNCFMAFDVQKDLENHIESKHTLEKYHKILICPICSKMYNSETYLTKHVDKHDESSSRSTSSSHKHLSHCEPASKYRKQSTNVKNSRLNPNQPVSTHEDSHARIFSNCNGESKESLVARSVNNMSVALDISKSMVTAASGLRLGVILESLASSNCPSPLVSAAASVWGQSWFPSSNHQIFSGNYQVRSDKQPNRPMCMDLLAINKQSRIVDVGADQEHSSSSKSHSSPQILSTPTQITDTFVTPTYPCNKVPHINTITTAFP